MGSVLFYSVVLLFITIVSHYGALYKELPKFVLLPLPDLWNLTYRFCSRARNVIYMFVLGKLQL
jgi:hypothetical protein